MMLQIFSQNVFINAHASKYGNGSCAICPHSATVQTRIVIARLHKKMCSICKKKTPAPFQIAPSPGTKWHARRPIRCTQHLSSLCPLARAGPLHAASPPCAHGLASFCRPPHAGPLPSTGGRLRHLLIALYQPSPRLSSPPPRLTLLAPVLRAACCLPASLAVI
jgi:hypothetical protein